MNDNTGDFVCVTVGERAYHSVADTLEDAARLLGHHERGWYGEVFFDHVRGVIDASPQPAVDPHPYLLVAHYRDFDWTTNHRTEVKEFSDAAALLDEAQRLVAAERASGNSTVELWEVYGVRTRERRPRPRKPRRVDDVTGRLLEDIRNAPDDDEPRLVWADAVGGERGELVVIQIDLERGTLAPRDAIVHRKRQRQLLARHGREWSGLGSFATRASFRRGFVDAAELRAGAFLRFGDEILAAAPLLAAVTVDGLGTDTIDKLSRLYADPAFRELRGVQIDGARFDNMGEVEFAADYVERDHGDDAIEMLVASGVLRNLRALGIARSGVSQRPRMLLGAHALHRLERLATGDYLPSASIVALLRAGGLDALRALAIGGDLDLIEIAPEIPTTVVELDLAGIADFRRQDLGLAELVASPVAKTLERLAIDSTYLRASHRLALPRLRCLEVRGNIGDDVAYALAAQPLPALRELAIEPGSREATQAIVRAFGPQLELLDLRGNHHALRHVNDYKRTVAGELLVGDRSHRRALLRVGPTTQLAWWDHVLL